MWKAFFQLLEALGSVRPQTEHEKLRKRENQFWLITINVSELNTKNPRTQTSLPNAVQKRKIEKQRLKKQAYISACSLNTEFLLEFPDTKKSLLIVLLPAVCTVSGRLWLKGITYRRKTCPSDQSRLTSSAWTEACINAVELNGQILQMFEICLVTESVSVFVDERKRRERTA